MTSARRRALLLGVSAAFCMTGCGPRTAEPGRAGSVTDSSVGRVSTESSISFRDVTSEAGITWKRANGAFGEYWLPETMGGGGAFFDYDNDGYLDILLVNGDRWPGHSAGARPRLALYRNDGAGSFRDVTRAVGADISLQGMGVAVGDYDGDGWDDLYITAVGGNSLLRNVRGTRFVDETDRSGVRAKGWGTSAAWLDYDRDGLLDLFVCNYVKWTPETDIFCGTKGYKSYCRPQEYPGQSCLLFRNRGSGKFEDVTKQAGVWTETAKALGVCVLDLEDDGDPDLVVANDMEPNFVFRNDGRGKFQEVGFASGISVDESGRSRAGMGIDSADFLADGSQGLAIGNFSYEGVAFYPLVGRQPYAERSKQTGLYAPSYPYVTFGLTFGDFDNDCLPDICITNGHIEDSVARTSPGQTHAQPCVLYRNVGGGKFADASAAAGDAVTRPVVGRGLCRGDYDNDGRLDLLLIPNVGPPRLLHNESETANHWLVMALTATTCNRNAYGARVTVEAGGTKQTAWCRSGSSYLSANDRRLHFGLGSAAKADRITVRWPNGAAQELKDVTADRVVQIVEGKTAISPGPAARARASMAPRPD
jgi:enediyne biosynthesis protein E4